jgi:hypothetical protein
MLAHQRPKRCAPVLVSFGTNPLTVENFANPLCIEN